MGSLCYITEAHFNVWFSGFKTSPNHYSDYTAGFFSVASVVYFCLFGWLATWLVGWLAGWLVVVGVYI